MQTAAKTKMTGKGTEVYTRWANRRPAKHKRGRPVLAKECKGDTPIHTNIAPISYSIPAVCNIVDLLKMQGTPPFLT
jgi:hypothetical protein